MSQNSEPTHKHVSLAQAILAPLNAIFQAQVQASRAFLNYVLSMGFHHTFSKEEIAKIKQEYDLSEDTVIKAVKEQKKAWDEANKQKEAAGEEIETEFKPNFEGYKPEELSAYHDAKRHLNHFEALDQIQAHREGKQLLEPGKFKELVRQNEGLFTQNFRTILADGSEQEIHIPTLSLLPMKPLAIDEANFKFVMSLNTEYSSSEGSTASGADKKRPWMAIEPREFTGAISKRNAITEESSIEIEIKIAAAPLPAGLDAMLTTLSQNVRTEKVKE